MKYLTLDPKAILIATGLGLVALLLAGCPPIDNPPPTDSQAEYDAGYDDGFAVDEEYWQGFDDSYDTVDGGTIYYSGSEIPYYDELSYDAGYWDGVWYAYNDGYFVAYDYAFTVGFSEGYDVAFQPGYAIFLQNDQHLEYLDGGFSDGYNDGFSEGSVFGAWDYANGWPFDWLDGMLDYRSGTDLDIAGVGTGYIELYQYGTDPVDLLKSTTPVRTADPAKALAIRNDAKQKADTHDLSYRDIPAAVRTDWNRDPATSPRSDAALRLDTTWLERIEEYRDAIGAKAAPKQSRGE
ncbi:MAG: hypothetical protein GC168_11495 [Candidatus Hydrogenedens sp.]|nr:hypothetical protein [Candidatus Hydrogenedens sp.]